MDKYIILHPFIKLKKKHQKVFVFDFDETLGSFGHFYYLWDIIKKNIDNKQVTFELFKNIMNLYPEFLRYGILVILEFLYYKKIQGKCNKIFLYTNNQSPIEWVNIMIQYITSKIPIIIDNIPLFDKIIYAFKIKNKIIEINRTTNKKTYDDFIKCTVLSNNTEICFIDDIYHSDMIHNKIYYIQPRSYKHNLSKKTILSRLFSTNLIDKQKENDIKKIFYSLNLNDFIKTENDKQIDILVSRKMMYYIKDFFYIINTFTKKQNYRLGKFTRKNKKINKQNVLYDLQELDID